MGGLLEDGHQSGHDIAAGLAPAGDFIGRHRLFTSFGPAERIAMALLGIDTKHRVNGYIRTKSYARR
jgi:hypothetical protein